jgi:predicted membrane-bound spermidine synthase
VDGLFAHLQPVGVAYLVFIGGVLCPLAWLLGQTVPVLTNLMKHMRTGEASGHALYWSTLGSFLGSVSLSLGVMQWLGVSAAVLACALGLAAGSLALARQQGRAWAAALAAAALAVAINLFPPSEVADTAYADYAVSPVELPATPTPRLLRQQLAGLADRRQRAAPLRPLHHPPAPRAGRAGLRRPRGAGAGRRRLHPVAPGALNRYTYVDIDPEIRAIAEARFLKGPIRGDFIVDDARRFVAGTPRRFDAVVVDVFSSHTSIPGHLVTREFWNDARRALAPAGCCSPT